MACGSSLAIGWRCIHRYAPAQCSKKMSELRRFSVSAVFGSKETDNIDHQEKKLALKNLTRKFEATPTHAGANVINTMVTEGENELPGQQDHGFFIPTYETHEAMVDGVKYKYLHIVRIKSTKNNTHVIVTEANGIDTVAITSAGIEGFKHTNKGTQIAAQSTGLSAGLKALKRGVKNVRVVVCGVGSGRLPAIKGLEQAGLNIVSLTDETVAAEYCNKPKKIRRT